MIGGLHPSLAALRLLLLSLSVLTLIQCRSVYTGKTGCAPCANATKSLRNSSSFRLCARTGSVKLRNLRDQQRRRNRD